jgi:DNA-binding LytR/AlgR family response regulator
MSDIKTTFLFVKSEYKWVRIDLGNVLYLSGLRDYTQVYIKGKTSPITTLQNLKEFEAKLPTEAFIRIHKSFIVAIAQIDSIGKNEICIGENTLPIGNAYKQALNLVIEKHS